MKRRWNGSIQSGNVPTYNNPGMAREDFGLYRAMITGILYVDDDQNISKNASNPEVLYECVILGGHAQGQTISNCRAAPWIGGNGNYSELVLTPSSKDVTKDKLQTHDGDIVLIQFIQGHDAYPMIIAMGKGITDKTGAKKADGPRFLQSYNGLKTNINKDGEFTTTMMGGSVKKSRFEANKEFMAKEEWLKTEQIKRTFKSGLSILEDGKNDKVVVTTAGGVVATVDGKGNKISIKAGSTEVIIDGASGKITLKGEMIDLGASVADVVTQFTQLASAFSSHMHPYTDDGAPSMTGPPNAPLLSTVGSQTVKVQA